MSSIQRPSIAALSRRELSILEGEGEALKPSFGGELFRDIGKLFDALQARFACIHATAIGYLGTMKNGFLWQGFEAQVMGGSLGRVSGQFEFGKLSDDYSLYVTGDATRDGGWRYFSPSSLFRLYGDLGYRAQGNELHFTASGARTTLGVIGPTLVELLAQEGESAVFTSPQKTLNDAGTIAFNGRFDINPQWSVVSNFYIRTFAQRHTDGNDSDIQQCSANSRPPDQSSPGTFASRTAIFRM